MLPVLFSQPLYILMKQKQFSFHGTQFSSSAVEQRKLDKGLGAATILSTIFGSCCSIIFIIISNCPGFSWQHYIRCDMLPVLFSSNSRSIICNLQKLYNARHRSHRNVDALLQVQHAWTTGSDFQQSREPCRVASTVHGVHHCRQLQDLVLERNSRWQQAHVAQRESNAGAIPLPQVVHMATPPLPSSFHGRLASCHKWKSCDIGEAKEGLENELWHRWSNRRVGEWAVM